MKRFAITTLLLCALLAMFALSVSARVSNTERAIVYNFDSASDVGLWQWYTAGNVPLSDYMPDIITENGITYCHFISPVGWLRTYDIGGLLTSRYPWVSYKYRVPEQLKDTYNRSFYFVPGGGNFDNSNRVVQWADMFADYGPEWKTETFQLGTAQDGKTSLLGLTLEHLRFFVCSGTELGASDALDIEYIGMFQSQSDAESYANRVAGLTLETLGAQIRSDGKPGLRFGSKISNFNPEKYESFEFGTLLLPDGMLDGQDLTFDVEGVVSVPAVNIFEDAGDSKTFTAVVTDIPTEGENVKITARPYVKYTFMGIENYIYGETITRSMQEVKEAAADGWDK